MTHRNHRSVVARMACALVLLGPLACDKGDDDSTPRCADGPSSDERAANQRVFDGLEPICAGCHITGTRGYFASIEAFEDLLAYEPSLVTPGDPDASAFVRLLDGKGNGAFVQMPPAGPTYAQLAADGNAELGMDEIRSWVTELGGHAANPLPLASAPRVSRIGAGDLQRALYQQLGLDDDDFFQPASSYDITQKSSLGDDLYPMSSAEAVPGPFEGLPVERFASLGGGSAMYQRKADGTISPSFAGSLAQVSQRWCALAIDKVDNEALFGGGGSSALGKSDAAGTKAVLRRWSLHFHAVDASDAEVDQVFDELFVPLEAGADARTAWVGTCSWFIRHPDWVFY